MILSTKLSYLQPAGEELALENQYKSQEGYGCHPALQIQGFLNHQKQQRAHPSTQQVLATHPHPSLLPLDLTLYLPLARTNPSVHGHVSLRIDP